MTADQQNDLIYDILQFTMEDGSPISHNVKADVIIERLGLPSDIPQLRRLIALGAARHEQRVRRRALNDLQRGL